MIISSMVSYTPHTFSNTKAKKPWFNSASSRAVKNREAIHKKYRSNISAETHTLYISACSHGKSTLQLTKTVSSIEIVKSFPILTLLVISGI